LDVRRYCRVSILEEKPGMFSRVGTEAQLANPERGGIGKARMTAKDIVGQELTVFDIASDGWATTTFTVKLGERLDQRSRR
jgi:hypothetical protein